MQNDPTHDDVEAARCDPSFAAVFEIIRGEGEEAENAQVHTDGRDPDDCCSTVDGRVTVSAGGAGGDTGVTLRIDGEGAEVWALVSLDAAAARALSAALVA